MDLHTNGSTTKTVEEAATRQAQTRAAAATPVERRYVHLEGRAIVRPATDAGQDVLEVTFVDGKFEPLTGVEPLFVYADEKDGLRLMCHNLHIIASLSEAGYTDKLATLKMVNPQVEPWADLEVSTGLGGMTPTGPPPPPPPQ